MNFIESRFATVPLREPNRKPLWRGDHSFDPKAAAYSLEHIIEPEVKKKNPGWSNEQVHQEATKIFQTRLQQDYFYEQKENAHVETAVQWEIVETSPGTLEMATKYGDGFISLRELWDHTRQYAEYVGNPKAYNKAESDAQMRMQEAFIRGEFTGFVNVLSHPDSVRYVQVWEKNDEGIFSKQVDLYKAIGRDFTHSEGDTFIGHITQLQQQINRHVKEEDVRIIAKVFASYTSEKIYTIHTKPQDAHTYDFFSDHIGSREDYAKERIEEKEFFIKEKKKATRKENFATDVITDYIVSKRMLDHIAYIPETAGAVMYWMTEMVTKEKQQDKVDTKKPETKSEIFILPVKKSKERKRIRMKRKKSVVFVLPELAITKKIKNIEAKIHQKIAKYENEKVKPKKKERVLKRLVKKFTNILFVLQKIEKHGWRFFEKSKQKTKKLQKIDAHKETKISLLKEFVVALTFFSIGRFFEKTKKYGNQLLFTVHKKQIIKENPTQKEESRYVQEDSFRWVLLAIIWHLAQLREGNVVYPSKTKKKSNKNKQRRLRTKFLLKNPYATRAFQFVIK